MYKPRKQNLSFLKSQQFVFELRYQVDELEKKTQPISKEWLLTRQEKAIIIDRFFDSKVEALLIFESMNFKANSIEAATFSTLLDIRNDRLISTLHTPLFEELKTVIQRQVLEKLYNPFSSWEKADKKRNSSFPIKNFQSKTILVLVQYALPQTIFYSLKREVLEFHHPFLVLWWHPMQNFYIKPF